MGDSELLKLAAKADGRDVVWKIGMHAGSAREGLFDRVTGHAVSWNPLSNDGDALKLAVNLRLSVDLSLAPDVYIQYPVGSCYRTLNESDTDCRYAAARRAIVIAAAEIGKEL
jgi:hypothetical protein